MCNRFGRPPAHSRHSQSHSLCQQRKKSLKPLHQEPPTPPPRPVSQAAGPSGRAVNYLEIISAVFNFRFYYPFNVRSYYLFTIYCPQGRKGGKGAKVARVLRISGLRIRNTVRRALRFGMRLEFPVCQSACRRGRLLLTETGSFQLFCGTQPHTHTHTGLHNTSAARALALMFGHQL